MWNKYREYGNAITFTPSANATVCLGEATTLSLAGVDTSKCFISWNGGAYGTDTFYVASPSSTGNITASVKYKNGLGAVATHNFLITVTVCTNIEESHEIELQISPNPTTGDVFFSGMELFADGTTEFMLYNALGELIYTEQLKKESAYILRVEMLGVSTGIYYSLVRSATKYSHNKLVYLKK